MRATQASPVLSSVLFLSSLSFSNAAVSRRALTTPNTLPGAWAYKGCYVDIGRTINDAGYTNNTAMTDLSCINYCSSKGFQYAGTEYYSECYCGSQLAAAATTAPESDCSAPCTGDSTQPCGGGSRLSMFYSSQPVGPQPNPGVNNFTHIGCYSEGANGRTLLNGANIPGAQMTAAKCTAACQAGGFILAGVEYGGECYCGNTISNGGAPASSGCNMQCNGNQSEICGGPGKLNVYDFQMKYPVSLSTSTSSSTSISTSTSSSTSISTSTSSSTSISTSSITSTTPSTTTTKTTTSTSSTSTKPTTTTTSTSTSSTSTKPTSTSTTSSTKTSTSTTSTSTSTITTTTSSSTSKPTTTTTSSSTSKPTSTTTASSSSSSKTSTTTSATSTSTSSSSSTSTSTSNSLSTSSSISSTSTTSSSTSSTLTSTTSTSSSSSTSSSTSSTSTTSSSISSTLTTSTSVSSTSPTSTSVSSTSTTSGLVSSTSTTSTSVSSTTSSTTSSVTTKILPTAPYQPATVNGSSWYGCQTEATNIRALSATTFSSDTMTLEACQTFCAAYNYFGVEYARECYCGNTLNAGSVFAPATDCSMVCPGNKFEYCGNGNRLSVYSKNGGTNSVSSSSSTTQTGTGTSGTATATTATTSTPTSTGFPTGWTDQGCWLDGANGRILSYQAPDSQTLTKESCSQLCSAAGYSISGTEWAQQCFCGNSVLNGGKKTADTDCTSPCAGNNQEICGAGGRMSIVSNGAPTVILPPAVQISGLNGSWAYQGCFQDNVNDKRTFQWQLYFPNTMTANQCLNRCRDYGYMAAGLEYGQECYCGDPANIATSGAGLLADSQCNVICAGNSSAYCGGGGTLSTYFWTGKPFYTWSFPQDYRAGKYDILINGVTIPLMTMQSITGKVTFMSKFGTGKANETGAYELDLSVGPNDPRAWRPLHVKTDIFCAAGLVLPDKGGRQLTIGGWAGDSTEGVRLYWPDGSPGVWGTHDWQENVAELSLQTGRWYPSAMVMSNGSIMVIGGEVGSNGAAVPTIEILPYTGSKPLYMDWLDRTNPNNLYPFVCILPKSGGIFVAYWNEARILNPATFDTIKQLPNAPGAVNDDKGGRTYPLEGTAVLLPQKAPYTEDLVILMCGGSTNGPGNSLDNCVSTAPEAANPTWTLERMPSTRVMPCMAPLPDGTILIANGAYHGVAGFGLAVGPNLNALLYDPTQEAGSRITVMANTTIARLYHSEAITLLDGRVLISGSNPEDDVNPEEYRVEVFSPPYLLGGKPRPTLAVPVVQWAYGGSYTVNVGVVGNGAITATLLGAVSSTHGNSMGARTLMPAISCNGGACTVTAPPNNKVCPPGWYQFFVLDGGIPAVGVYVRIGGDPAGLGNWPQFPDFTQPGV